MPSESTAQAFEPTPGVHMIDNDTYHGCVGVPSKSGLQTILSKSPRHFRFGERKEAAHFALGDGAHAAILEPERFEAGFMRGPADRRGNKWKDAELDATSQRMTLLIEGDYDIALRVRDGAHRNPTVRKIVKGCIVEPSGFWIDPETGVLCRCRPDAYNPGIRIIGDVKTTADANPVDFRKSVDNYGYHFQEAMYSEGFPMAAAASALDYKVDGFAFIVIEKSAPFVTVVYELEPSAVDEGYAMFREALAAHAECAQREAKVWDLGREMGETPTEDALMACWPAYGDGVQRLDIPPYAYRRTSRTPA